MTVCPSRKKRVFSALLSLTVLVGCQLALPQEAAWARFRFGPFHSEPSLPELKSVRLSPDAHALVLETNGSIQPREARSVTVLRFPAPNRLMVDIPGVKLGKGVATNIAVGQAGIDHIELDEIGSDFYHAVRATIYVTDNRALSVLNPSLNGKVLHLGNDSLISKHPARDKKAASPTKPTHSANKMAATPIPSMASPASPLQIRPVPTAAPSFAKVAAPPAAPTGGLISILGTPIPAGINMVESVSLSRGRIVINARDGAQLRVKSKAILGAPSRLVVDLDNTLLSSRDLLGDVKGDTDDEIRNVRVGQFDEKTVRLVIETPNPESFETLFTGSAASTGREHDSLTIVPIAAATPRQLVNNGRPGEIENIDLRREHGGTLIRLTASSPILHKLAKRDEQVTLDLLNESGNATNINFDSHQFPELSRMRLEVPGRGSRLAITMSKSDTRLIPTLTDHGKTLELLLVNDGGVSLSSLNTAGRIAAGSNLSRLEKETAGTLPEPMSPAGDAPFAARIVVDAGHGGKDNGANRNGVNEKDLNLSLALMLRDALVAKGFKVYMTRSTDVFLPLPQITAITNQIHPDLFISIHHNASVNTATHGIETYYFTPQSIPLANKVHAREISRVGERSGGVKQARFYVIHHTSVPAILCEVGYVSNPAELQSLQSMERKSKTAQAIADGVVDYLKSRVSASAKAVNRPL